MNKIASNRKPFNKGFVTFAVVIVAFSLGIISLTWEGPTTGLDLLAVLLFIFTGWFAQRFNFGKI